MANDTFLIDWILSGEKNLSTLAKYLDRIKKKYGYSSPFLGSTLADNNYPSQGILKQISSAGSTLGG